MHRRSNEWVYLLSPGFAFYNTSVDVSNNLFYRVLSLKWYQCDGVPSLNSVVVRLHVCYLVDQGSRLAGVSLLKGAIKFMSNRWHWNAKLGHHQLIPSSVVFVHVDTHIVCRSIIGDIYLSTQL